MPFRKPTIGQHIANCRVDAELTQTEFGRRVGKSRRTVSKIENDQRPMETDELAEFCKVLPALRSKVDF